jgi:cardiolipin synthase
MARKSSYSNQYTVHNKVQIIRGGADYFNCIEAIADSARYVLHLQTYIFDGDETGQRVVDALVRAAQRKVAVYLLLDSFASKHLPESVVAHLKEQGVHFAFFAPIFKGNFLYMGRRLHHKLVVADGYRCLVAGINISNRYNDMGAAKAWLDWAVHVEGEVAMGIHDVCERLWNRSPLRRKCNGRIPEQQMPAEECLVRIRRNDWVYKKTEISRNYREIFLHAQHEVTVMTSYFWPPHKLLVRMAAASKRGVKIRLILTAKADVPLAKYTERYLYSWLFRNNIAVFEYQKNVLHGKMAVCDNELVTAGSYNVNNISAFASVELNLEIKNEAVATEVCKRFEEIINDDCEQITEADFKHATTWYNKLFYYLSYRFTHAMFYLFTFYFRQRSIKS